MENKNILDLILDIPPSINNDYIKPRAFIKRVKGKQVAMASMYELKKAKDFKKDVVKKIKTKMKDSNFVKDDDKFVRVEFTFFFPRTNMDTNNYYKCVIDAFTESGCIWKDDNISMITDNRIFYDSENPRVEIKIYQENFCGIFENEKDLEEFKKEFCYNCKKGNKIGQKGGCSIYKKAIEGRIQKDMEFDYKTKIKKCLKFKQK